MQKQQRLVIKKDGAAYFNAAAWYEVGTQHRILILRKVSQATGNGEPDWGELVLVELDRSGSVLHEITVWSPDGSGKHLEDPRALVLPDGRVMIGLTAVVKEDGVFVPFPAVLVLPSTKRFDKLPEVSVLTELGAGKNTTPIDSHSLLFRREGDENNHRLHVVEWDGEKAVDVGIIDFPKDLPWASWRIGTTTPPFWISEHEALLIIHGIRKQGGLYIYSLGRAKLVREGDSLKVSVFPQPLLTPDDFMVADGQPLVEELNPSLRRVVYATGGLLEEIDGKDNLNLFVNVGDRQTIEMLWPLEELKKGLWEGERGEITKNPEVYLGVGE